MLVAQVYVPSDRVDEVVRSLTATGATSRISRVGQTFDTELELLSAELDPRGVEAIVASLEDAGIDAADIIVHEIATLSPIEAGQGRNWFGADPEDFVWVRLVGQARRNARLVARYLALMSIAGVIAAFGVVGHNEILIVGAMAVSPDLLPVCGACVGVVGRRPRLVLRAIVTLVVGLLFAGLAATLLTLILRAAGDVTSFSLGSGGLGLLTTVNYSTVGIALAAGIAGMLAFETNASAAVGVAISVTTIPAAAYAGVALGTGSTSHVFGALDVLAVNVVLLLTAGTATLALQRRLRRRPSTSASLAATGPQTNSTP
jgi:uncharacterized hydrophobic protein (TIGR00271 family)